MKIADSSLSSHGPLDGGIIPLDGVRLYQIKREIEAQIVRALMKRTERSVSRILEADSDEI